MAKLTASAPDKNIWISASAGSGKTKTLIDRVLRLLICDVNPNKILCLTYTKAAANEMLQRITNILSKWLLLTDDRLVIELTTLTDETPSAKLLAHARSLLLKLTDQESTIKIQTIHSFCQSIIGKFPIESGLSLETKIIDDYQQSTLLNQAKHNLLKEYQENETIFAGLEILLENTSEYSFDMLLDLAIEYRHKTIQNSHDLNKKFDFKAAKHEIGKEIDRRNTELTQLIEPYQEQLRECISTEDHPLITTLLTYYHTKEKNELFEELYSGFFTLTHSARKSPLSKRISETYQLSELVTDIQDSINIYLEKRNYLYTQIYSHGFKDLVFLLDKHYEQLKKNKNFIDYDDLINLTIKLLENQDLHNWIMYKLDDKIEHLLVDESQDVSLEQWKIITILTKEFFSPDQFKSLFVVGDQKQSIFSFQGADPALFADMKDYFHYYTQSFDNKLHSIDLNKSFRSGKAILEFVDKMFSDLIRNNPNSYIGQYNQHIAHKDIASKVELWPLILPQKKEKLESDKWQINTNITIHYNQAEILAKMIATEIKEMLATLQPKDIIILIRKRTDFTKHMIKELKEKNIPVSGLDRINLSTNLAIMDLLSLAKFTLLPTDDYNLACLLKSPYFACSEARLLELTLLAGNSLWDKLKDSEEEKRLKIVLNIPTTAPYQFFVYIIDGQNYRKKLIDEFGFQINEVIDEFLNCCLEYEEKQNSSLQEFVTWFAKSNIIIKRDIDSQNNVVRIMTIHASKGLQAKCVFLPDTTTLPKTSKRIIWSDELNMPLYSYNSKYHDTYYKNALAKYQELTMQEYYRLLYVGTTRAIDRLIICGYSAFENIPDISWYNYAKSTICELGNEIDCNNIGGYNLDTYDNDKLKDSSCYVDATRIYIYENKSIAERYNSEINEENRLQTIPILAEQLLQQDGIFKDNNSDIKETSFSVSNITNQNAIYGVTLHEELELAVKHNKPHTLIDKLKTKFSPTASFHAEVAIASKKDGKSVINRLDLLVIDDDHISVIDYKSKSFSSFDEIPQDYIDQLQSYYDLVKELYPNKTVKCHLLSIANGEIFLIPQPQ